MSIEKRKLFHFVSKLLFSTIRGEITWQKHDSPPSFLVEWIQLLDYPSQEDYIGLSCYRYSTPDSKSLWFFVFPQSQNGWLELRNRESKLELTIDGENYGSLSELYQAIREKENGGYLRAAEETIDLILNGNKEAVTH